MLVIAGGIGTLTLGPVSGLQNFGIGIMQLTSLQPLLMGVLLELFAL